MMGLLGAMSGGGAAMGDIGSTLFKSAAEEERALRVAEYQADAKSAQYKMERGDKLADEESRREWEREKIGIEHKNRVELEGKKGGKYGGKGLPSEAALAEWMVSNGVAKDAKDAWGKVRSGRYSPEELAMKYATSVMGKPNDYYPGDDEQDYQSAFDETYKTALKQFSKKLGGDNEGAANEGGLPNGIPAGSKQIGTSGGKPVYESLDGKRYIVE